MTPRLCKYGCGKELQWDTAISLFKEKDDNEIHTKERCKSFKKLVDSGAQQQQSGSANARTATARVSTSASTITNPSILNLDAFSSRPEGESTFKTAPDEWAYFDRLSMQVHEANMHCTSLSFELTARRKNLVAT